MIVVQKRSEILDLWGLVVHIWCTLDLVTFKDILGSFGALAIFREAGPKDKRSKYFAWLQELNGER